MSRKVEYMPLADIKGMEGNPKRHADEEIGASVQRFGYVELVVLDERTKKLVAGHGRVDALRRAAAADVEPPDGVLVKRGAWLVPVVRGWKSRNDSEARAYVAASNKLSEIGGWDDDALRDFLGPLATDELLVGTGFSLDDLARLGAGAARPDELDEVPPVPVTTSVRPGDLYALGEHRIACGDSTEEAVVASVLGGLHATCVSPTRRGTWPTASLSTRGAASGRRSPTTRSARSSRPSADLSASG